MTSRRVVTSVKGPSRRSLPSGLYLQFQHADGAHLLIFGRVASTEHNYPAGPGEGYEHVHGRYYPLGLGAGRRCLHPGEGVQRTGSEGGEHVEGEADVGAECFRVGVGSAAPRTVPVHVVSSRATSSARAEPLSRLKSHFASVALRVRLQLPKMADPILADLTECAMGCGGHAIAGSSRWRMAAPCPPA